MCSWHSSARLSVSRSRLHVSSRPLSMLLRCCSSVCPLLPGGAVFRTATRCWAGRARQRRLRGWLMAALGGGDGGAAAVTTATLLHSVIRRLRIHTTFCHSLHTHSADLLPAILHVKVALEILAGCFENKCQVWFMVQSVKSQRRVMERKTCSACCPCRAAWLELGFTPTPPCLPPPRIPAPSPRRRSGTARRGAC